MHEAYEISHLLTLTMQIESIAVYDNNILIGTRQGQLVMYSLSKNKNTGKYEVQLLHMTNNFSKKPIQQIEVIPESNLLLCLTDNILGTYNLGGTNFPLITSFAETKGASLFALDNKSATLVTGESNSVARLCVAVRRKLLLYYGKNVEFKKVLFDFSVPDVPKAVAWGKDFLCVGLKAEYLMFELSSDKPKELFPTSSSRSLEPIVVKFSETSFLLGRDQTSVLVEEGRDVQIRSTVRWQEAPLAVVWDEPYILALMQDQVIVQTVMPYEQPLFIQTLPELNKARLLYRCKSGLVFVSSVGQLWCLGAVDVTRQRQQLLKQKHYDLAIQLTKLSDEADEEKHQKISSIQMLHAIELFDRMEYSQSMKEFIQLNTDPSTVIKLFPVLDSRPGEVRNGKWGEKDVEAPLNALIEYLTILRARISGKRDEAGGPAGRSAQMLELIDTTLLKCYLLTNDAFIAPLLRLDNCRLEEAEKTLQQHNKHSELIILYSTKGQHTKALQLLREQAKQPDSSLKGYHRTKKYLQGLGAEHLNLIFKFSDWILKEHPEEGLKIFTEDIVEVEQLPRPKVLDFLLREHESLVIPYLEHVIHTWGETNPSFHDALITKYRQKITDKEATTTDEELQHTKSKLVKFLEESSCYTPERMILHFPNDSMFEERALILGKLGRHEQTLAIYVRILGDVDRAIRYCETVTSRAPNTEVYVTLMRILMNPEQGGALTGPLASAPRHPLTAQPDLEAALDILEKHAEHISPLKALSVLPDSVPLVRLKRFLESALDSQLTRKRRTQLLKGLLYAEHLQMQELKQFHESKCVVINDYNVCPVCKKRFGNQSAFVRYPNGDIVHYSCRVDK